MSEDETEAWINVSASARNVVTFLDRRRNSGMPWSKEKATPEAGAPATTAVASAGGEETFAGFESCGPGSIPAPLTMRPSLVRVPSLSAILDGVAACPSTPPQELLSRDHPASSAKTTASKSSAAAGAAGWGEDLAPAVAAAPSRISEWGSA